MNPAATKALLSGLGKQMEEIYERCPGLFPEHGDEWIDRERALVKDVQEMRSPTQARAACRRFITDFNAACRKHGKSRKAERKNRAGDPIGTQYPVFGELPGSASGSSPVEVADGPEAGQDPG